MSELTLTRFSKFSSILTASEQTRFPKWLANELEDKDPEILKWVQAIWVERTQELAWKKAFPKKKFDAKKIPKWENRLMAKLELFLSIEEFKKEEEVKKLYFNRFTLRRAPELCYGEGVRKTRNQLTSSKVKDHKFYWIQHELDRLDAEFSLQYPDIKVRRYKFINPEAATLHYKLYILLNRLEVTLSRLSRDTQDLEKYDFYVKEELEDFLASQRDLKGENYPVAEFYLLLFQSYTDKETFSYDRTELLINKYKECFPELRPDAQYNSFLHVYNFLARSQNQAKGQSGFYWDKLVELSSWFFNKREVKISRDLYSNQTTIYTRLAKDFSETDTQKEEYLRDAELFIKKNKEKLSIGEAEDVYRYNLAMIHFTKAQYHKVINLGKEVFREGGFNFRDIHLEINFQHLHLKSLYESKERMEDLPDMLKASTSKINNSTQLSLSRKQSYGERSTFFRKMVLAERPYQIQKLLDLLTESRPVSDALWFKQKLIEKKEA